MAPPKSFFLSGASAGLVGAIALYATYPGWLSFDSAYQLWTARSGLFTGAQPPFGAAVWSALLRMGLPPGALLVAHVGTMCAGLWLLTASMRANPRCSVLSLTVPVSLRILADAVRHVGVLVGACGAQQSPG